MSSQPLLIERTSALLGMPIVTLDGEDVADVRDVVLGGSAGSLLGFTTNKRGFLGGPRHEAVRWERVHAVGHDAVMVATGALEPEEKVLDRGSDRGPADILGARVVTDSGAQVGRLTDAVVRLGRSPELVGYVVEAPTEPTERFLSFADTWAVSSDALVVPDDVAEDAAADLSGFATTIGRAREGRS